MNRTELLMHPGRGRQNSLLVSKIYNFIKLTKMIENHGAYGPISARHSLLHLAIIKIITSLTEKIRGKCSQYGSGYPIFLEKTMSSQADLKPETIFFILRTFSKSISGNEGEKSMAQIYRSNLCGFFGIPESGLPLKSNDVMMGSQSGSGIQTELKLFFECVSKKLLKDYSGQATLQHVICLSEILQCELEFSKYKLSHLVQKLLSSGDKASLLERPQVLDGACREIIEEILSPNWEESVNKTRNQLAEEQIEQEILDQDFSPDFKLISTHLFTGGFFLAIVAGLSSQSQSIAWHLIPFIFLGFFVSALFTLKHKRASATAVTAMTSFAFAALVLGSMQHSLPALKLLGFTGVGAILGSLMGIYRGLSQWNRVKKELIKEFKTQRFSEVLSHQSVEPDQLLRLYNESFLPRWIQARTLVASRLNEAFSAKDEVSGRCQELKTLNPERDFDHFFDLHKSLNQIEGEMSRLDRLYEAMKTLETRLKGRMDFLQYEACNQGSPILQNKGPGDVYLRLIENEGVLSTRTREHSRHRMEVFISQLSHIEDFLKFEILESRVSNLEQWSCNSPELLSHIQSSAA